ncbi:hypothetical protein GG681_15990 [Epibacterium sp. SM1969]|uniref:Uncharacterized protein n=1 Tax=Tritonibacter aquimaris TaxID=2663379 RepID=A0A844AW87_9RHOB|nr:hypothetical protein [Tritonibacter aquimaris]MQY44147.1 hypothetical protein [Tritonibacter aquimaris]
MPIDPARRQRKRRKSKQRRDLKTGLQLGASLLGLVWVAQTAVGGFEYYSGTRHSFLWFEHGPNEAGRAPSEQRLEQAQSVLAQLGRHDIARDSWLAPSQRAQTAEPALSPSEWLNQTSASETAVPIARAGLPVEFLSAQFAPAGQPLPDAGCKTADCADLSMLSEIETVSTHAISPQALPYGLHQPAAEAQSSLLFAADQDVRQARELCYRYLSSDEFRSSFKIASSETGTFRTRFWGSQSGDSTWAICNNIQRYVADVRKLNDKLAGLEQMLDQHQAGLQSKHVFASGDFGPRMSFAPEIYLQQVIAELAQAEAEVEAGTEVFYLQGAKTWAGGDWTGDWTDDWGSAFITEGGDPAP